MCDAPQQGLMRLTALRGYVTENKMHTAHLIVGEAAEALFYEADSITRKTLIDKLYSILQQETGGQRKAAIIEAIKLFI